MTWFPLILEKKNGCTIQLFFCVIIYILVLSNGERIIAETLNSIASEYKEQNARDDNLSINRREEDCEETDNPIAVDAEETSVCDFASKLKAMSSQHHHEQWSEGECSKFWNS